VTVRCGCRVERLEAVTGGVVVETAAGGERFDRAVVTLPPPVAARLCPGLTELERARCQAIDYQGIVCASLLVDAPLTPYYITNIADASIPFTAVIEMTALVDPADLAGQRLLYLPKYVASSDPMLRASDDEVRAAFLPALERMHPHFSADRVRAFRVSRVPYVFPIPTVDYSRRVPDVRTSVPGLFLTSSAHIVNGTLNVNETVKLAHATTASLLEASPVRRRDAVPA
jgi:protoporphyrinogen oxidase